MKTSYLSNFKQLDVAPLGKSHIRCWQERQSIRNDKLQIPPTHFGCIGWEQSNSWAIKNMSILLPKWLVLGFGMSDVILDVSWGTNHHNHTQKCKSKVENFFGLSKRVEKLLVVLLTFLSLNHWYGKRSLDSVDVTIGFAKVTY